MTDLDQLADEVQQLREDIDYLTALIEPSIYGGSVSSSSVPTSSSVARQQTTSPPSPTLAAHVWHLLTPTQAAQAWPQLTDWVDWLIERYQLADSLPVCWYRHGAIVEELDALRAAWNGAYTAPDGRPTDPAYWQELLARGLARVREWDRYGCAAGTHQDDAAIDKEGPEPDLIRDEYIYADVARRATQRQRLNGDA